MIRNILAGQQELMPSPMIQGQAPIAMPGMMPQQMMQQPMMDVYGQQVGGLRQALMGRFMNAR